MDEVAASFIHGRDLLKNTVKRNQNNVYLQPIQFSLNPLLRITQACRRHGARASHRPDVAGQTRRTCSGFALLRRAQGYRFSLGHRQPQHICAMIRSGMESKDDPPCPRHRGDDRAFCQPAERPFSWHIRMRPASPRPSCFRQGHQMHERRKQISRYGSLMRFTSPTR